VPEELSALDGFAIAVAVEAGAGRVDIAVGEASSSPPPLHAASAIAARPSKANDNNCLFNFKYFSIDVNI